MLLFFSVQLENNAEIQRFSKDLEIKLYWLMHTCWKHNKVELP